MNRSLLLIVVLAVLYVRAEGIRCKSWDNQSTGYCKNSDVCLQSGEKTPDDCQNGCDGDPKCAAFAYRAGTCYRCKGNCPSDDWWPANDDDLHYECEE